MTKFSYVINITNTLLGEKKSFSSDIYASKFKEAVDKLNNSSIVRMILAPSYHKIHGGEISDDLRTRFLIYDQWTNKFKLK